MRFLIKPSELTYFWVTIISFFGSALFFLFCFAAWAFQGAGEVLIDRVTAFSAISLCIAVFSAAKASSRNIGVVLITTANYASVLTFFAVWAIWARGNIHPVVALVSIIYAVQIFLSISRYKELRTSVGSSTQFLQSSN